MFKDFGYKKGKIELSNKGVSFCDNAQQFTKIGKPKVTADTVAEDSPVIKKYKDKPVWVAIDISNKPVTYAGCIATNIECNYKNAHEFIIAQLIEVDSISRFANLMGEDSTGTEFLRTLVKNDRNLQFWENLAIKWFSAKWMGVNND